MIARVEGITRPVPLISRVEFLKGNLLLLYAGS